MSSILMWVFSLLVALLLFSLAVFIHEFGHFLVAHLLGLRADVFSIGFGPALWKRKIGNTELRFSAIPFGGYVSLPQLDPEGMEKLQGGEKVKLPPAPPWKRMLVAVAGPLGNVVLAVVCAALIAWFAPEGATGASTEVGYVEEDSAAEAAGLQAADRIVAVNGNPVRSWSDFQTECYLAGGSNTVVRLTVARGNELLEREVTLDTRVGNEADGFYVVGGLLQGPLRLGIQGVMPGSPAEAAGLSSGDAILSVDGAPFERFSQILKRPDPAAPVVLQVQSIAQDDAPVREICVTPAVLPPTADMPGSDEPKLGIGLGVFTFYHFPWMAERGVGAQMLADSRSVVRVMKSLVVPKSKGERKRVAKGLGGPLMIFSLFAQMVQMGLWVSLGFLRMICVNLAILNLLPLPVLDGGHILFALYATIFRREVSPRVMAWLTNAFAILLIGVMVWFLFNDTLRLIR